MLKKRFLQGLRFDVWRYVLMADPQCFRQAVQIAKREECEVKILRDFFVKTTGKLDKVAEKVNGLNLTTMNISIFSTCLNSVKDTM